MCRLVSWIVLLTPRMLSFWWPKYSSAGATLMGAGLGLVVVVLRAVFPGAGWLAVAAQAGPLNATTPATQSSNTNFIASTSRYHVSANTPHRSTIGAHAVACL